MRIPSDPRARDPWPPCPRSSLHIPFLWQLVGNYGFFPFRHQGAPPHLPALRQHFTHTQNGVPQKTPHPQQGRAPRTLSKPWECGNPARNGRWPGSGSAATGVPGPRPKVAVPELTLREAARLRLQRRKPWHPGHKHPQTRTPVAQRPVRFGTFQKHSFLTPLFWKDCLLPGVPGEPAAGRSHNPVALCSPAWDAGPQARQHMPPLPQRRVPRGAGSPAGPELRDLQIHHLRTRGPVHGG